ncbi:hypothetical protein KP509_16G063600 [Ceratopteris richardii]|uniref:Uncharacterized protein n=1 Tax=Ceratopteris richardii TaxID=49495 RepID=A0A8T2T0Y1_CERRI|nr:hypothetical protein KP509_16G063600 [Ceratopteris richardii]
MKRARRVHSRSANALRKQKATKTHRRRHSHHHKGKAAKVSAPRPKRTYLLRHRTRSYDRHAGHLANLAETPTRRSHHPRHSHRRHYRVVPHQKQRQTISHQKKQLHSLPLPVNYRGHPRRSSRIAHQLKMCYCPKAHFGDFHGKDFPQGSPKRACHVHMTNHGVEM